MMNCHNHFIAKQRSSGVKAGIRLNIQKMSGEHFNDVCIYIIVRTVSVFVRAGS